MNNNLTIEELKRADELNRCNETLEDELFDKILECMHMAVCPKDFEGIQSFDQAIELKKEGNKKFETDIVFYTLVMNTYIAIETILKKYNIDIKKRL